MLRHTFASHLAQQGVPFQDIACLLGHSTTYVTERYAHMAPDSGSRAIPVLEETLRLGLSDDALRETALELATAVRGGQHELRVARDVATSWW